MNEDNDIGAKAGEIWLVRCGYKAGIDGTDGAGDYPIRGWVEFPDGKHAWQWTRSGRRIFNSAPLKDLVCRYDWRAELAPIWAVLKPEYRWLAQDDDGRWWCYAIRPTESGSRWKCAPWALTLLSHLVFPEPYCPWHETLTERPD